jgi:hypothetical protein
MLVIGLSIEDEARQVADWAAREHPRRRALILTGNAAWQRAAGAFAARWNELGRIQCQRWCCRAADRRLRRRRRTAPWPTCVRAWRPIRPHLLFAALDAGRAAPGARATRHRHADLHRRPRQSGPRARHGETRTGRRAPARPALAGAARPSAVMVYPRPVDAGQHARHGAACTRSASTPSGGARAALRPGANSSRRRHRPPVGRMARRGALQRIEAGAVYRDGVLRSPSAGP